MAKVFFKIYVKKIIKLMVQQDRLMPNRKDVNASPCRSSCFALQLRHQPFLNKLYRTYVPKV